MTDSAPYSFRRKGRSWSSVIAVLAVWALLLVGWAWFDAAPVLLGVVFALTIPAVWDVFAARMAGADLSAQTLSWFSGKRRVEVPLDQIDHVRLVTRLDLTVRAVVVLTSGKKLRLPAEATPRREAFETALSAVNLKHQRHHFTFL